MFSFQYARLWAGSSWQQVLKALVAFVVLSAMTATANGATTLSPASESSATVQVGTNFTATFAVTGSPQSASSYAVSGLPSGLSVTGATFSAGTNTYSLNAPFVAVTGTPTVTGNFPLIITAWELPNAAGASRAYGYTFTVTPGLSTPPLITIQPASRTVTAGSTLTFAVAASGTPAPTFQWQKDAVNISGATGNTYTLFNVSAGDAGNYTVIATNAAGTTTSNVAVLEIIVAPSNAVVAIAVE